MFLFEENTPEAIIYHQNNLICDLLYNDVLTIADMYEESCYIEETAKDDDEKASASNDKKSLTSRIIETIQKMLAKIHQMITGFKEQFASGTKRLTADDYMGSETARVKLDVDIAKLQEAVNEEYLESRKFVQKLSKITPFTAQECADFCDKMEKKIHDNKQKILPVGKALVNTAQIAAARKQIADKVFKADELRESIQKNIDKYDAHMVSQSGGLSSDQGIALRKKLREAEKVKDHKKVIELQKQIKTNGKYVDPSTLKGISRATATMSKMINTWTYHANRLAKPVKSAVSEWNTTGRKEAVREIKRSAKKQAKEA